MRWECGANSCNLQIWEAEAEEPKEFKATWVTLGDPIICIYMIPNIYYDSIYILYDTTYHIYDIKVDFSAKVLDNNYLLWGIPYCKQLRWRQFYTARKANKLFDHTESTQQKSLMSVPTETLKHLLVTSGKHKKLNTLTMYLPGGVNK